MIFQVCFIFRWILPFPSEDQKSKLQEIIKELDKGEAKSENDWLSNGKLLGNMTLESF